jgi:adenylate kinase family enzyme
MFWRVHILGASGVGTTTLASALARRLDCPHLDTDDYFWLPTRPPFTHRRPAPERHALLEADLARHAGWVLSGSLCGWGDVFIPRFHLVVFVTLPRTIRLARLMERERQRYDAAAIAPGGTLHSAHQGFMAWAAAYDEGGLDVRSLRMHEQWLAGLPSPVLRVTSLDAVDHLVAQTMQTLSTMNQVREPGV